MISKIIIRYLSAVYGNVIDPLIQNQVVVAGTKNAAFTCSSDEVVEIFLWVMWKVGGDDIPLVSGGEIIQPANFNWFISGKESHLIVKVADLSTAGVYSCKEQSTHFAQLVVIGKYFHCYEYSTVGLYVFYVTNSCSCSVFSFLAPQSVMR